MSTAVTMGISDIQTIEYNYPQFAGRILIINGKALTINSRHLHCANKILTELYNYFESFKDIYRRLRNYQTNYSRENEKWFQNLWPKF